MQHADRRAVASGSTRFPAVERHGDPVCAQRLVYSLRHGTNHRAYLGGQRQAGGDPSVFRGARGVRAGRVCRAAAHCSVAKGDAGHNDPYGPRSAVHGGQRHHPVDDRERWAGNRSGHRRGMPGGGVRQSLAASRQAGGSSSEALCCRRGGLADLELPHFRIHGSDASPRVAGKRAPAAGVAWGLAPHAFRGCF